MRTYRFYVLLLTAALLLAPSAVRAAGLADTVEQDRPEIPQVEGKIPLIIGRPVTNLGDQELKNKWLLLLCESYLYFRFDGIPVFDIASPDTLSKLIAVYRDYSVAVSKSQYAKAASRIDVPFLLYLQCEYNPLVRQGQLSLGEQYRCFYELSATDKRETYLGGSKSFPLKEMGTVFDGFITDILNAFHIPREGRNERFLKTDVAGEDARSLKRLGQLLASARRLDTKAWAKLEEHADKLMRKSPDMLLGYYALAKLAGRQGRFKAAARYADNLMIKLGKAFPPGYLMAMRYARLAEDYERALNVAELAEGMPQIEDELIEEVALCYEAQGEGKGAVEVYKNILAKDPENMAALIYFAKTYNADNRAAQALEMAERALEVDPENQTASIEKARSLIALDKTDEALAILEKVSSAAYSDPKMHELMGDALVEKKMFEKAIESYNRSLISAPKNPDVRLKLASAHVAIEDYAAASEAFVALFNLDPDNYKHHLIEAGAMAQKAGDEAEAKMLYERYLARGYENDTVSVRLARLLFDDGKYERTASLLTTLDGAKKNPDMLRLIVASYEKLGQDSTAAVYREKLEEK